VLQKVLMKYEHPELPEDACVELKTLWPTLRKCWSWDPGQRPVIMELILGRFFERNVSTPVASVSKRGQHSSEPVHRHRHDKKHWYQDKKRSKSANATTRLRPPPTDQPNKENQYQPGTHWSKLAAGSKRSGFIHHWLIMNLCSYK
jgi:hypothetical protein